MSMLPYIFHQQSLPAPELIAAMTGSSVMIGALLHVPVKLILDNQSTSAVVLSVDIGGVGNPIQWKTFAPEEALILDGDCYTWPKGTIFYGNGTASGNFSISYTYINL